VAKRSPILGYNHNVRYRGLVFHVQTEDSGVLSPHLFTHLFFTGVIVSTRKLVYDSGSAEESIKSLMQAQHKAVLKDLRRGHFDDKIDEYLGGTPGLLPRGTVDPGAAARESEPVLAGPNELSLETEPTPKFTELDDQGVTRRDPTIPDVRRPQARSLAERVDGEMASSFEELDPVAAAAHNATVRTSMPADMIELESAPVARDFTDSAPEIEIQLELDEPDEPPVRSRTPRDTDIASGTPLDEHTRPTIDVSSLSDGIPKRGSNESIPPLPPPPPERRPSAGVGASALPPARPITRPPARPAITPPQVVTRPVTQDPSNRNHRESDSIEVYSQAPASAEIPPGERGGDDRPGQYSQHKRPSSRIPDLVPPPRERSAGVPVPPGLGRPGRVPPAIPPRLPTAVPVPATAPVPQQRPPEPTPSSGALRARTTTPTRTSVPSTARTGSPSSGGVVMTRPAVIVGAPSKPSAPSRVRKAREDEGRGFGQGLISEKSLDEVILAYLSEDADDK
jgi:hypothetical protein